MDLTRRKALLTTGAAVGLAGCTGDVPRDSNTNPNGNGTGNSNSGNAEDEVFQLGSSLAQPVWTTVEDATGFITVLEDEYDDM